MNGEICRIITMFTPSFTYCILNAVKYNAFVVLSSGKLYLNLFIVQQEVQPVAVACRIADEAWSWRAGGGKGGRGSSQGARRGGRRTEDGDDESWLGLQRHICTLYPHFYVQK